MDLEDFFVHIIQFPSLHSNVRKLHLPNTKSDLLKYFEQSVLSKPPSNYDHIVSDGAVIVHCLPTKVVSSSTFNEYTDKVFIPYINKQLEHSTRVGIM